MLGNLLRSQHGGILQYNVSGSIICVPRLESHLENKKHLRGGLVQQPCTTDAEVAPLGISGHYQRRQWLVCWPRVYLISVHHPESTFQHNKVSF